MISRRLFNWWGGEADKVDKKAMCFYIFGYCGRSWKGQPGLWYPEKPYVADGYKSHVVKIMLSGRPKVKKQETERGQGREKVVSDGKPVEEGAEDEKETEGDEELEEEWVLILYRQR